MSLFSSKLAAELSYKNLQMIFGACPRTNRIAEFRSIIGYISSHASIPFL